jgi:signal transduction histidine kinase
LTKIENNQFPDKKEIAVNELTKKLLDDYSEVYANRKLSISLYEDAQANIEMNETLARVLFGNLLKNAFVHNSDGGSIEIYVNQISISIANTGADEALNTDTVFNRFGHTSTKEGSTGLGLALSKSVCNLYGIDIRYHFSDRKHTFILFFR